MRYKVDLKRFMADCEANYCRLLRLFPCMAEEDHHQFMMAGTADRVINIRVLERSPFTSQVELSQLPHTDDSWTRIPTMRVRIYHDAQMAEVVSCATQHRVRPRNPYPNDNMHHPDEKAQWNRFLAEWLSMCLNHGYAQASPFEFAD